LVGVKLSFVGVWDFFFEKKIITSKRTKNKNNNKGLENPTISPKTTRSIQVNINETEKGIK
jgi:hypothetical protein